MFILEWFSNHILSLPFQDDLRIPGVSHRYHVYELDILGSLPL